MQQLADSRDHRFARIGLPEFLTSLCEFGGVLGVEIENRLFFFQGQHLSGFCAKQIGRLQGLEFGSRYVFITIQQPALHPLSDRGQILRLDAVLAFDLDQVNALGMPKSRIDAFCLAVVVPRSVDVEEVAGG